MEVKSYLVSNTNIFKYEIEEKERERGEETECSCCFSYVLKSPVQHLFIIGIK